MVFGIHHERGETERMIASSKRLASTSAARLSPPFEQSGFAVIAGVLAAEECVEIARRVPSSGDPGGRHLLAADWCVALAAAIRGQPRVAELIPPDYVAVQCLWFEKSISTNWLVALHQDLGIPVAARSADPALAGWSEKQGVLHVQPPVEVLEQLIAIRLHLDDCDADDGPLMVVPGSHRLGRLAPEAASRCRAERGEVACLAARGSIVAMRPLLLHSSSRATGGSQRRVLHFLFGPRMLPHGLRWRYGA